MFSRVQKAVTKYQEAQTEEEEGLKKLETYVTDFSIVGGDSEGKSSLVKIINLNVEVLEKNIKAMLVIEGEASKIEYSIDNGKTWNTKKDNPVSTEFTFENQEVGSYFVRVRVTDKEGKSIEAISDIVRVGMITTAEVGEVLEGETYITGEGKLETGEMTNNVEEEITLGEGEEYIIPQGYHNGSGKVKTSSDLINKMTVKVVDSKYGTWNNNALSSKAEYTIQNNCTCIAIALLNCYGGNNYVGKDNLTKVSANISLNGKSISSEMLIGQIANGSGPRMYIFEANPGDNIIVSCTAGTSGDPFSITSVILTDE